MLIFCCSEAFLILFLCLICFITLFVCLFLLCAFRSPASSGFIAWAPPCWAFFSCFVVFFFVFFSLALQKGVFLVFFRVLGPTWSQNGRKIDEKLTNFDQKMCSRVRPFLVVILVGFPCLLLCFLLARISVKSLIFAGIYSVFCYFSALRLM